MNQEKCCSSPCSDYLVCTCMGVMYSDICTAIKDGAKTFKDLEKSLLVGTGCSSCRDEIEDILSKKCTK